MYLNQFHLYVSLQHSCKTYFQRTKGLDSNLICIWLQPVFSEKHSFEKLLTVGLRIKIGGDLRHKNRRRENMEEQRELIRVEGSGNPNLWFFLNVLRQKYIFLFSLCSFNFDGKFSRKLQKKWNLYGDQMGCRPIGP